MQTSSSCNAARGKLTVASISPTIFGFCPRPVKCYFSIFDSKSALLTSSRCGGFKWPVTVSSFLVIFTGQTPRRRWLMLFAFLGPDNSSQRSSSQFKAGFFLFFNRPRKVLSNLSGHRNSYFPQTNDRPKAGNNGSISCC